ncbi:MAG: GGDEF domain-containing protein [Thermus sp.]
MIPALAFALCLALLPSTAPWSERLVVPLFASWAAHRLWRWRPVALGVLAWGIGDLGYSLDGPGFFRNFAHISHLLGYLGVGLGLVQLPGKTPKKIWFLPLPAFLMAASFASLHSGFLNSVLGLFLILLLARGLESAFQEGRPSGLFFFSFGLGLLTLADLLRLTLDPPAGSPFHFLWILGYALLTYRHPQDPATWEGPALALAGSLLAPTLLGLLDPPLFLLGSALYYSFLGGLGLLLTERTRFERAEDARLRWARALEKLARLSPRASQILSLESLLFNLLDAVREISPAEGLEVRSHQALVGQRTPYAVPIPLGSREEAYLYFSSPPRDSILNAFLTLVAGRLRQLLAQLDWANLALTDPLTELLNRRGLELQLPKLVALARRYAKPVSVAMLDLDHFKRVNDTYGHPVGDEVLRTMARTIQASLRTEDLAVRYGGEEFLLLLFNADLEEAKSVAERIRDQMRKTPVPPVPWPLTLSAGLAGGRVPKGVAELEEWVYQADFALLKAKEEGRDRVVVATEPPS